jgi:glycosyltransferase involved in cell wall biosynthesis
MVSTRQRTTDSVTVAVIIPCYNHAHFLPAAIESALKQTWPHCEVIVVDDGSSDDSSRVAQRYDRVILVRQGNRGLSAARNAGLKATAAEIVIFLDADDCLWPAAARTAVEVFQAAPEAALTFGRCRVVSAPGAPGTTKVQTIRNHSYEELLRDNPIWTPAMAAFRRRVLDAVGVFDEHNSPAADYDLYLRISRQFPVVSPDATVVDYRQHSDNMSRDPVLMLDATLTVLRRQQAEIRHDARRAAAYRDALANWRACYGERLVERFRTSLKDRRYRAAGSDAVQLLRLYPAGVRYHVMKKLALIFRRSSDTSERVADVARP